MHKENLLAVICDRYYNGGGKHYYSSLQKEKYDEFL